MAYASNITETRGLVGVLKSVWSGFARTMDAMTEANSRGRKIEELMNLTDTELAKKGLRRDDIVRHVFADRMGM